MMHSFDIRFEDTDTKIDKVVVAVALIDAFSGRIVRGDIRVTIDGLFNQAVRNLSGLFVFVNLPSQASYTITIDTTAEGYFNPPPIEFVPPASDDPDRIKKRRLDVLLYRRPSVPVDPDVTAVAGVVVRPDLSQQGAFLPVAFASIRAEFAQGILLPGSQGQISFKTFSDERGAFVLALRLPQEAAVEPIIVRFIFEKTHDGQIDKRIIERPIKDQDFLSFDNPIDIEGPDIPIELDDIEIPRLIEVPR